MRHCRLCGGAWLTSADSVEQQLTVMADALTPRGPDSAGYWSDPEHAIALAHRRLAIIEPSEKWTSANDVCFGTVCDFL